MSYSSNRIILYDKDGNALGDLGTLDMTEPPRMVDEVNGEHSLTLHTTRRLVPGTRALWQDDMGAWREYVVTEPVESHRDGEYYCVWSLQYDLTAVGGTVRWASAEEGTHDPISARQALSIALQGQGRWQVGTVESVRTGGASLYHGSTWDYVLKVREVWGGELSATIEVDATGVTARRVNLVLHVGREEATRRFDWGEDVSEITRTPAPAPYYCRVRPYGGSAKTDSDGVDYSDCVTIEGVEPNGRDYIQDDEVVDLFKTMNPDGTYEYPTVNVVYDVAETSYGYDDEELYEAALAEYTEYTRPKVTYEATVVQYARAGLDYQGVAEGDEICIVDRGFDGETALRLQERVMRIEQDLPVFGGNPDNTVLTIGEPERTMVDTLRTVASQVNQHLSQQISQIWSGGTIVYLQDLVDELNAEINATGGYYYLIPGVGIRTYDHAVEDPMVGTEASQVVEIRGGAVRIANSRTASGDWDWKTVFVSGHVAADLVTAANITTGFIGNVGGGSYWDLDNGVLHIGGMTATEVVDGIHATVADVDVEYASSESGTVAPAQSSDAWDTDAPAWQQGRYIWQRTAITHSDGTVTYTDPVMISGRDGQDGSSVTVSVIEYGTSASAATAPSSYSTTVPSDIAKGTWLWVRTTYSDGSTSTAKSYMGTDGQDGASVSIQSSSKSGGVTTVCLIDGSGSPVTLTIADGEDGAQGTPGAAGWVHVAWATSADGSTGFSTTVSAGKTYIGVYTDQTQADSEDPTDYSWSLIKGEDGQRGSDGLNQATVYLYQRAASKPAKPSASTTYTFATATLSGTIAPWSVTIPDSDGNPCWVTAATASSNTATDTIAASEWAGVTKLVKDGETGATGLNQATVYLYQRAVNRPSKPSAATTYTFSTATLSGSFSPWQTTIPDSDGTPCWVTAATASSNEATDTIAASEWAGVTKLFEDGGSGIDGLNQATVYLYKRTTEYSVEGEDLYALGGTFSVDGEDASIEWLTVEGETAILPTFVPGVLPDATTYTFETGALAGNLNGWSRTVPDGGGTIWVISAAAIGNNATDAILAAEWSAPARFARDGSDGTKMVSSEVSYGVSADETEEPALWEQTVPSGVPQGAWLWVRTVMTYDDGSEVTTYAKSYVGTDGEDGKSVYIRSASKDGKVTTLTVEDSNGDTATLTIVDGEDGPTGTAGANGYTHFAWMSTIDNSDGSFSTTDSEDQLYIGVYADDEPDDSIDWHDYSWTLVKGEKGDTGDAGAAGLNQATIYLYRRGGAYRMVGGSLVVKGIDGITYADEDLSIDGITVSGEDVTLPSIGFAVPSATLTYTFATGGLVGDLGGWSRTVPDGSGILWVTSAVAISQDATDRILTSEWAEPARMAEDGEGVNVGEVAYAVGGNGTTAPTGGWQEDVPEALPGQWLWVRTTYSDLTESYTCSYVGTDGRDGTSVSIQSSEKVDGVTMLVLTDSDGTTKTLEIADGEDGDNGTAGANGYVHIAWATSADGSTGFSTSESSGKTYIGAYTDHTEADSQDNTKYSWSLIKGADGTSVTVSSTQATYAASASGTTIPTSGWQATIPTVAAGGYLWTRVVVAYSDGSTATSHSAARQGADGTSPTVDGTTVEYQQSTSGTAVPTGTWYGTPPAATAGQYMWTRTTATYSDGAQSVSYSVALNGRDGTAAYTYSVNCNPAALVRAESGTLTPSSITFSATRAQGAGTPSSYSGRFVISEYDGSSWAAKYTSSSNEASKSYSPTSTAKVVRCNLYQAGGTTTLLDTQSVSIASNGASGADGYTVMLTNEAHTFAASTAAAVSGSTTTQVIAFKGATQMAATIGTVTGAPTGMTYTVTNNGTTTATVTVTVTTSLTTRQGVLTVPVTVDGKAFSLKFSWALALAGAKGDTGDNGINQATVFLYARASAWTYSQSNTRMTAPTGTMTVSGEVATIPGTYGSERYTLGIKAPALPSANTTYTFATSTLSGSFSPWTQDIPDGEGTIWVTTARAASDAATDTIAPADWADVTMLATSGTDGTGIESIEEEYYLSDSSTTQSAGSWQSSPADYLVGYHYWTRSKITWDDGTVTYTTPALARDINVANELARTTAEKLANYMSESDTILASLQDQIDGAVDIWYLSGTPSPSYMPWGSADDRDAHVGDLCYSTSSGRAYRYVVDASTHLFSWEHIKDKDAASALKAAQDAQATADGKRRVFTAKPTVPYDVGDLWVSGATVKYARMARDSGSYRSADWVLTATDDTAADAAYSKAEDAAKSATDYITYENGEMILGRVDSAIQNVLTSTMYAFRNAVTHENLAYFGLSVQDIWELFTHTVSVSNRLRFNDFNWIARANGNMTLKYIEGSGYNTTPTVVTVTSITVSTEYANLSSGTTYADADTEWNAGPPSIRDENWVGFARLLVEYAWSDGSTTQEDLEYHYVTTYNAGAAAPVGDYTFSYRGLTIFTDEFIDYRWRISYASDIGDLYLNWYDDVKGCHYKTAVGIRHIGDEMQ